jgi:phage recombination protein Bet
MSTALVKTGGALARQDTSLSNEQIDLLKRTIAKGATDDELQMFIQTSKRLGLDPFARQIFIVKRYDSESKAMVAAIQVSIDGFRLVAERSGQYRGQTAPQWCGPDGKWVDLWTDTANPPFAARVGVHRAGFVEPLYRTARWGSYAQFGKSGLFPVWSQYGDTMLAKCAESQALRAAFPNELSGIYSKEEMGAANDAAPARERPPARTLDSIAAEGERERPLATTTSAQNTGAASISVAAAADATPHSTNPTTAASTADGELLDAEAWRVRYEICVIEATDAGCEWLGADEYGLPEPKWACPVFGPDAKRMAGKRYDDASVVGWLRAKAQKPDFANASLAQRLWTLRSVARHELAKTDKAAAAAGGESK